MSRYGWRASGRHLPPEHHVELGEAEDERIALVDEDDVDRVAEGLGKNRRQLEAAEAGAQDDDACLHGVENISTIRAMARIIGALASSHTPTIGFAFDRNKRDDPAWAPIFEHYEPLQRGSTKRSPTCWCSSSTIT